MLHQDLILQCVNNLYPPRVSNTLTPTLGSLHYLIIIIIIITIITVIVIIIVLHIIIVIVITIIILPWVINLVFNSCCSLTCDRNGLFLLCRQRQIVNP